MPPLVFKIDNIIFISPDQVLSAARQILFLGGLHGSFLFLVNNFVEMRNSSEEKLVWEEHDVTSKMDGWYLIMKIMFSAVICF